MHFSLRRIVKCIQEKCDNKAGLYMCGIAGHLGRNEIRNTTLRACLDLMKQRGPDFQAYKRVACPNNKTVTLLHSRLNIIDLTSSANQPFYYNGKYLSFNGEIYNYIEIRKKLEREEYSFETESDTEVLLKSIDAWGLSRALDELDGMWAFALFDSKSQTLSLARDRFGEKPLYYYSYGQELFFGSEIKLLAELSETKFKINFDHLSRFLINGYKSLYKAEDEFFLEVQRVPAGSFVDVDLNGSILQTRYWSPHYYEGAHEYNFDGIVSEARGFLIDSVEKKLRADQPIAFCLSGGIDSNGLVGIAKNVLGYDVHAFSIQNQDERYEERDIIKHVVKNMGVKHTDIPVRRSDNPINDLREIIRYHDAPLYTSSFYISWLLQKAINDYGYKISISGLGADEIFSGYFDHHLSYIYEIREDKELFNNSIKNWQKFIYPIVRNPYLKNPRYFVDCPFDRRHIYLGAEEFGKFMVKNWFEPFGEKFYTRFLLRNRMLNEMFHEAVPVILHEDDLNSMYFSIENRSPYLDRKLFEYMQTIPTKHLIKNGRAKFVLRSALKGIVSNRVLENPRKVGFNAPLTDLVDLNSPDIFDYLTKESPIYNLVDRDKMLSYISSLGKKPKNSESKFLFNFLNIKIFCDEFGA